MPHRSAGDTPRLILESIGAREIGVRIARLGPCKSRVDIGSEQTAHLCPARLFQQACPEPGRADRVGLLQDQIAPCFIAIERKRKVNPNSSARSPGTATTDIRKRYWEQRFWQRGYFSTTSGNITDDIILRYLDKHGRKNGSSPSA